MTVHTAPPRRRLRTKVTVAPATSLSAPGVVTSGASTAPPRPTEAPLAGQVPPFFSVAEKHADYVIVQGVLDDEMLRRLVTFLKKKRPQPAKMKNEGGNSDDERKARYDDRDSRVSWFNAKRECTWLHQRLADLCHSVGNAHWPLMKVGADGQLQCEYEETQYAVYGPNQHFKAWHRDAYEDGHDPEDARQFTVVLMVSPRSAYTAGHLQAKLKSADGRKVLKSLKMDAGDAVVFPAKRLEHRVTPVKTGLRQTLVFWASDKASCKYYQSKSTAGDLLQQAP